MPTTGRGRGTDDGDAPVAPPIPSFASLRAPKRSHPAMDVLAPPPARLPFPTEEEADPAPVAADPDLVAAEPAAVAPDPAALASEPTPAAAPAVTPERPVVPRPAEWPDLLRFGVRMASAALRLPGVLVREPARRLRRLLGE